MKLCAKNADLMRDLYLVRIYNRAGEHVASLLPCSVHADGTVSHWDLCHPDGPVFYCGIKNELVDSFADLLGWQTMNT